MLGPHQGLRLERMRTEIERDKFAHSSKVVPEIAQRQPNQYYSEVFNQRKGGGRTRIRTRVFGLEGQSDIQTTLYVLVRCGGSLFKKVTID